MPVPNTEIRKIDGNPGRALLGNAHADAHYVDKRGGVTTTTLVNNGPDVLTLEAVTIVSGAGASTVYTLGAPSTVAAGSSTTITGPTRMSSAGRCRVRIQET